MSKILTSAFILLLIITVSYGFRRPDLLNNNNRNNPNKIKLMQDYIKSLEETIHKLDGDVTRLGPSYYLYNATEAASRRTQFLNNLMLPGSSGTYATSNSFYLYGKLISTAVSVSFVPIQNINNFTPPVLFPNIPQRPPQQPQPQPPQQLPQQPIIPPQRPQRPQITTTTPSPDLYDDYDSPAPARAPEQNKNKINPNFYNPYIPQYYPYFLPATYHFSHFIPLNSNQKQSEQKGVPTDRYGADSKFG